ncbi:MAG: cyclic nucleotide-binding domain-containing protein, partial [Deltaproteobacteria bacterium]|nr:cyclic nucleotide-binding domain-containing protein [Deltaproteobacteria bacterium]
MEAGDLGRVYKDGEVIVRQGEAGDCMYVIQAGKAEVLQEQNGRNMRLAVLEEKDFFGEMAL